MRAPDADALDMFHALTLTVTVRVRNLWRLRFGLWLLSLAARVLRCRIDPIVTESEANTTQETP
jgi:hypothetical protein